MYSSLARETGHSTPMRPTGSLHGQAMRTFVTISEASFVRLPAALVLTAIWAGAADAHHSFSSIYDSGKTVTLSATVREFQFIHPHPFLVVEVRNDAGERQTWRAEMDNRFELEDIGITGSTFRPGDRVIVSGTPRCGRCAGGMPDSHANLPGVDHACRTHQRTATTPPPSSITRSAQLCGGSSTGPATQTVRVSFSSSMASHGAPKTPSCNERASPVAKSPSRW